jgi:hypothetical protein
MAIIAILVAILSVIAFSLSKNSFSETITTPSIPTTPTTPSTPSVDALTQISTDVQNRKLNSNLQSVCDSAYEQTNALTQITSYSSTIASFFNIHPIYIVSIAYAETYFGYNLYDPVGQGFGLSQMETVTDAKYNTLMTTAKYILNNYTPTTTLQPLFTKLDTLQKNLQTYIKNAQASLAYIAGLGYKVTDLTNPLIDIPLNLLLIAGYIKRIEKTNNINANTFSNDTAEKIAFYYHKGLGAKDFDTWANSARQTGGYLWRIQQITKYIS